MKDELIIRIKPDGAVVLEDVTGGVASVKHIEADNLLKSIRDSVARDAVILHSGLLPQNCIAFSEKEDGGRYAAVAFDAGRADVIYHDTGYPGFPLPRLVFGFHLNAKGRIAKVDLGVTAHEKLREDTQMYVYPFSNVAGFSLCLGRNEMPSVESLSRLSNLPWFILGLPNNDDRFNERGNALRLGHRALLEHLKDKDTAYYYEKILIPMKGATLRDFITND